MLKLTRVQHSIPTREHGIVCVARFDDKAGPAKLVDYVHGVLFVGIAPDGSVAWTEGVRVDRSEMDSDYVALLGWREYATLSEASDG